MTFSEQYREMIDMFESLSPEQKQSVRDSKQFANHMFLKSQAQKRDYLNAEKSAKLINVDLITPMGKTNKVFKGLFDDGTYFNLTVPDLTPPGRDIKDCFTKTKFASNLRELADKLEQC